MLFAVEDFTWWKTLHLNDLFCTLIGMKLVVG